jgi:DNA-binding NarL/FixJ family response regulator
VRVVVAEDNAFFREALTSLLQAVGIEVAAAVEDGAALLDLVLRDPPDVAIIDVRMPPTRTDEGLLAALEVRRRLPGTAVLVITAHNITDHAVQLVAGDAGGVGYLAKDRVTDTVILREALERVRGGGVAMDPGVVSALVELRGDGLEAFTARERNVLALIAEGLPDAAIERALPAGDGGVEADVRSVLRKLSIMDTRSGDGHERALAVLAWLRASRA